MQQLPLSLALSCDRPRDFISVSISARSQNFFLPCLLLVSCISVHLRDSLEHMQASPAAWATLDGLLRADNLPEEGAFFAANSLRQKIRRYAKMISSSSFSTRTLLHLPSVISLIYVVNVVVLFSALDILASSSIPCVVALFLFSTLWHVITYPVS